MSLRIRLSFPVLLAAALMLAAAPVSANGGRKHDGNHSKHYSKHQGQSHYKAKHHRKHHKHHYKKHHRRQHGHGGYGYSPYVTRHAYGYPVHHYGYDSGAYYCGPCSHYFDSYDHLSHHVHGHHGVAVLALPSVIIQASIGGGIGWVFGY